MNAADLRIHTLALCSTNAGGVYRDEEGRTLLTFTIGDANSSYDIQRTVTMGYHLLLDYGWTHAQAESFLAQAIGGEVVEVGPARL